MTVKRILLVGLVLLAVGLLYLNVVLYRDLQPTPMLETPDYNSGPYRQVLNLKSGLDKPTDDPGRLVSQPETRFRARGNPFAKTVPLEKIVDYEVTGSMRGADGHIVLILKDISTGEHVHARVGEQVGEATVASIESDEVVFRYGNQTISKPLN